MFRPETIPAGLFAALRMPTLGFLTEPLPRGDGKPHPDLEWRLADMRLIDRSNFDRIVSFDPLFVEAADPLAPVWRSVPLPVDDRFFAPVRASAVPPRVAFVGRSTEHRERYLVDVKHTFDMLHMAHGIFGDRLLELLRETDVAINLHNEPYPSFENRVSLHLAAANLVLSEPLSPTHGLEPGIDYVEVRHPEELVRTVGQIHLYPDLYRGASASVVAGRPRRFAPHGSTLGSCTTCCSTSRCSEPSARSHDASMAPQAADRARGARAHRARAGQPDVRRRSR